MVARHTARTNECLIDGKKVRMFFKFFNDLFDSVTPEVSIFISFIFPVAFLLMFIEEVLEKKNLCHKNHQFQYLLVFL